MTIRLPQRLANQLQRRDFSRNTKLLLAVSTLSATSYMGLFMLLRSLYILRLGRGPEYLGIYYLTGSVTYMVMGLPSGALSKRFGLKPILLLGGALMALGLTLFPLSTYVPQQWQYVWPLLSQAIITVGWSIINVNLIPALSTVTNESGHRAAYSLNSALRQMGILIGTFIGGWMPAMFGAFTNQTLGSPQPYGLALWVGSVVAFVTLIPLGKLKFQRQESSETISRTKSVVPWVAIAALAFYVYVRHIGWATCQAYCKPCTTDKHRNAFCGLRNRNPLLCR